jgi:hypothetical protein
MVGKNLKHSYLMIASMSVIALFLISSLAPLHTSAYSAAKSDNQKNISLSIQNGIIENAGPQDWKMSGGNLVTAVIASSPLVTSWSDLHYSLNATVNGVTSSGTFRFHILGTTADGKNAHLRLNAAVIGSVPGVCFPSYSVNGTCTATDTSEIPAYFVVAGTLITGSSSSDATRTSVTLLVEVAALNPFGQPIVISSVDNSILIVATYNHARTLWGGVQVGGNVNGTMGKANTPVSGYFAEKIVTTENYVTGVARDQGQISLVGMSPSTLNAQGTFHGTSTIPTVGSFDCSPPGLPGTCLATGFNSIGSFSLTNQKDWSIHGKYNVQWPAPSIIFGGTITAKLDVGSNSGD